MAKNRFPIHRTRTQQGGGERKQSEIIEGKLAETPFVSTISNAATAATGSAKPIAAKLVARMKRGGRGKIAKLKDAISDRAESDAMQKELVTKDRLHPAHATYVNAHSQVAVMWEQLEAMEDMAPMADIVSKAEDLYMPSAPPMSPLMNSYFLCWAYYDACVGPANETIGTTVCEVGAAFGMYTGMLRLVRLMQESRMGVYAHEGTEGGLAVLRELVTETVCRAIVPAGYSGKKGELWYARVLPPPIPGGSEHLVFTTPYILQKPGLREWQAYFHRTLPEAPQQARLDAYQRHMKYGPTRHYWHDFVFEGYVNYRLEAVYLAGLPDIPESRPHSQVNGWGFGR